MAQIEEPLLESAPLAWQLAPQLCGMGPATHEDCSPMHGVWQYLRVLGLVGSMEHRAGFYLHALEAVTGAAGAPRVLICGTADYAMLVRVLAAFHGRRIEPDITVLDLCETPLMLNRWYAERMSCRIDTARIDVMEFTPSTAFDAICTDAFLGRFPRERRPGLAAKLRELLRPGGKVITMNRLRPGSAGERICFSAEQARSLRTAALSAAVEMRELLKVDPEELARRAETYANHHVTHAVSSAEEVRELFEHAGFEVDQLSAAAMPADNRHRLHGPSILRVGEYLGTVARRP